MDIITYALCRKFVKKSLAGLGALRGSPCKIKSIVPTYSAEDPAVVLYNTLTLQWDSNEDRDPSATPLWHEEQVKVLDNGRGIYNIEYDSAGSTAEHNKYVVTFYDGTTDEFFIPTSSGSLKKKVVPVLPSATDADHNTIYLVPIAGKPGTYEQWLTVENDETHAWEWLSLGTTDVDLTLYQQKIDNNINRNYKNYDAATKAEKPSVPNVVGAINEHQDVLGTTYDYGTSKITGLNTYHNESVLAALNDIGDLRDYEDYDELVERPETVVEEINRANKKYTLEDQASIDRTKYIQVQKLMKDNKDGSPKEQIGSDIVTDRVDITAKNTPDAGDYRTYDLKVAGELKDPNDTTEKIYGQVKIPTAKIIKEDAPIEVVTDTVTPDTWTFVASNEYTTPVTLTHVPASAPTTAPVITLTPTVGGTAVLETTASSKDAVIHLTGTTIVPTPGGVTATINYEGESASIAASYYLEIEGKDWSYDVSGAKIEISKQMLVKDASVKVCTEEGVPLPQLHVNEKYIDFVFTLPDGSDKHLYIAVKDLINPQKGYKAIHIDYNTDLEKDEVKLYIDETDPDTVGTLTQTDTGLKIAKASTAVYGVSRFATESEVLSAASTPEIVIRPFDVYKFLNDSESVKDDINTYADPGTGEKVNKTTIAAINELLTIRATKFGTPQDGDVETYIINDVPTSGVTNQLGDVIHDAKQIIITDTLVGVTDPVPYFIYRLTDIEGENEPGLYMYEAPNWIKVNGDPAIRAVDELPTTNIKLDCFYKLKIDDTINARFSLTHDAKVAGYYADKEGIHYRGEISQDWSWHIVRMQWPMWYGDEICDDIDGDIYSVTHADGVNELIYQYVNVDNRLYYYHNGEWIEISPKFVGKYMDADENYIINIDADELKPQLAEDKGKTFVVQDDGTWALSSAGGIQIVEELPEFEDALDGVGYYLIKRNKDYDVATYAAHEKADGTKEWVIVGMENKNAYKTINKLGDYLYAIEYDDLDYDYARDYYEEVRTGGCTSIHTGRFMARNLDWLYDNTVEFVVRTPASVGRFATIGVTATYSDMTRAIVEKGGYNPKWKFVPFVIVDGMNETGLTVSVNVAPLEDDMVPTTGTNPAADIDHQMCASMIPRWLLDNYSVDNYNVAFTELHDNYNIYVSEKFQEMHYEPHYIVNGDYWYFKDNELRKINKEDVAIEGNTIMTNFRLHDITYTGSESHPVWDIADHTEDASKSPASLGITAHGSGLERFNMVANYFSRATFITESSLQDFLTYLYYSNAYRGTHASSPDPEWLSEAVGGDLTVEALAPAFEGAEAAMAMWWENKDRDNPKVWHTTHDSVYDTDRKTLVVRSQERELGSFRFTFTGLDHITMSARTFRDLESQYELLGNVTYFVYDD